MTQSVLESTFKESIDIESRIMQAAETIAPVWPIKNTIACNPHLYLEDRNFWEAMELAQNRFTVNEDERIRTDFVNRHVIKWIQSYLDVGVATIRIPSNQYGFYQSWKDLARFDNTLIETEEEEHLFNSLPSSASVAVEFILDYLGISEERIDEFLAEQISLLPGWAGYIRWLSEWNTPIGSKSLSLTEFLAVRMGILLIASKKNRLDQDPSFKTTLRKKQFDPKAIEHKEHLFANAFVNQIIKASQCTIKRKKPLAQWVFCIDVRSEPFRFELEKVGSYETFGFAGFFGLPVSISLSAKEDYSSCPVLLKPRWKVEKKGKHCGYIKHSLERLKYLGNQVYVELKYHFGTPYPLAETLGAPAGLWMGIKALVPQLSDRIKNLFSYPSVNTLDPTQSIPLNDQVDVAESALRMMGFTDFAPIVVFCGHGSKCQNNPFASSLHCGACGGNQGGPNAHLLASILNTKEVKEDLTKRGFNIPENTIFIGAEHNTTTDEITFFEQKNCTSETLSQIKIDAKKAAAANRAKRSLSFEGEKNASDKEIFRRSVDWSEVRPEWGLAKNGAFLIGPRTLSESLDLEGRAFLHSYDWRQDPNGSYLETILTAPMVVAQWINAQYFFSTIDPKFYSSGSKTTQNVVGKIGVMQGNGSDLMHGLPIHSVFASDTEAYHEPLRLLTVVFAPISMIDPIVQRQPKLQKLFYNEWVHLIAIDPISLLPFRLNVNGKWTLYKQRDEDETL